MRIHFFDLVNRYGPHIKILNLLLAQPKSNGKRSSEVNLNGIYQKYFWKIFDEKDDIKMINFDLKKCLKNKELNVYYEIKKLYLEKIHHQIGKFLVTRYSNEKKELIYMET